MKKLLVMLLMGLVATSFGVVNVNWNSTYGYFYGAADPGVGILGPEGSGKSTVAQLVYCGVNGIADGVGVGGVTTGDDVVWGSFTITEIGDEANTFSTYAHFASNIQNYQQAFVSGNVYARIFQDNAIGAGDWYFSSPILALSDITGNNLPQEIELAGSAMQSINVGAGTAQVVPEPATFLLFGIGGMGAWLLRRNKIKSREQADA